MSFCNHCGHSVSPEATACVNCGHPLNKKPAKSRGIAIALCFFLGGFGAHHFYLRNYFLGLFYVGFNILAGLTFPPAILVIGLACIADLCWYLLAKREYFERRAAA